MKEIYCDGSCFGNPGPGGWGVLINNNGQYTEVFGHHPETTNNQMELKAAITAVSFITLKEDSVNIYTDSQYVINGITSWIKGWKKNNWKTAKKELVKNSDLWKLLDEGRQNKKINWIWVKAHNGNEGNELADALAKKGTKGGSNEHLLEQLIAQLNNLEISAASLTDIKPANFKKHDIITNKEKEKFIILETEVLTYPDIPSYGVQALAENKVRYYIPLVEAHRLFKKVELPENSKLVLDIISFEVKEKTQMLWSLKNKCEHIIVQKNESAICSICQLDFGWYCAESPDKSCHYYSEHGLISLNDGTKIKVPAVHDADHESPDWCIFCHSPDERK